MFLKSYNEIKNAPPPEETEEEIVKCHLHKKLNAKCKFCIKYTDLMNGIRGLKAV